MPAPVAPRKSGERDLVLLRLLVLVVAVPVLHLMAVVGAVLVLHLVAVSRTYAFGARQVETLVFVRGFRLCHSLRRR